METRKLIPPGTLPDANDPNDYCRLCNKFYSSKKNYKKHLKISHKMVLKPLHANPKPNFKITPDPYNSSNHCDSCNWTFGSLSVYRSHLDGVHKMIIPRLQRIKCNPDISPDINDPNNYCKSCQVTYRNRTRFRKHLRRVHKMELTPLRKQTIFDPAISTSDLRKGSNKTSCTICKLKYGSKIYLQQHMDKHHSNGKDTPIHNKLTILANSNIQPDPNNPNAYCQSCERRYSNRSTYIQHIKAIHPDIEVDVKRSPPNPIRLNVDAGNCNNRRCTICEIDFDSRQSYLQHMNRVHKNDSQVERVAHCSDQRSCNLITQPRK